MSAINIVEAETPKKVFKAAAQARGLSDRRVHAYLTQYGWKWEAEDGGPNGYWTITVQERRAPPAGIGWKRYDVRLRGQGADIAIWRSNDENRWVHFETVKVSGFESLARHLRLFRLVEAEDPKKALRASQAKNRWKETEHGSGHMEREGWDFEIWYYTRNGWTFYLEATDENPGHPPGRRWRIGLKGPGEDRWRASGTLSNAMGEIEYGLSFERALARAVKWAEHNMRGKPQQENVYVSEGKDENADVPKKPGKKGGESPKSFFQKKHIHRMGNQSAEQILSYMPEEFVRAHRRGETAEWENPYTGDYDWWPSYDDDNDSWTQYLYYWDYRTEGGKLYGTVMVGDRDGNHDVNDEAEVGTEEYQRLEKEYGTDAWQAAMNDYYRWVVEHRKDPLGYIHIPTREVEKKWIVAFAWDEAASALKLDAIRRVGIDPPPSPPAMSAAQALASQDPDVKAALDYCLINQDGEAGVEEEDIIKAGATKDDKGRLILKFSITDQEAAVEREQHIVNVAQAGLERNDGQANH